MMVRVTLSRTPEGYEVLVDGVVSLGVTSREDALARILELVGLPYARSFERAAEHIGINEAYNGDLLELAPVKFEPHGGIMGSSTQGARRPQPKKEP